MTDNFQLTPNSRSDRSTQKHIAQERTTLLALIKQNPGINTSVLMARTALDHRTVYSHLSALREQEKIIALGYAERHTMMWAIKPRGR
jgi:predicted transcriptional regulator